MSHAFASLTRKRGGGGGRKGVETPLSEEEVWAHRVVLYLLAYVGVRPEDIARAVWGDLIDPDTGAFCSHMTVKRAKTDAGTKPRELFPPIVEVLDHYYRLSGSPPLSAPLILGPKGGGFDRHNWLDRIWRPALKAAGIKKYRVPYAARHSLASNLAQAGMRGPCVIRSATLRPPFP